MSKDEIVDDPAEEAAESSEEEGSGSGESGSGESSEESSGEDDSDSDDSDSDDDSDDSDSDDDSDSSSTSDGEEAVEEEEKPSKKSSTKSPKKKQVKATAAASDGAVRHTVDKEKAKLHARASIKAPAKKAPGAKKPAAKKATTQKKAPEKKKDTGASAAAAAAAGAAAPTQKPTAPLGFYLVGIDVSTGNILPLTDFVQRTDRVNTVRVSEVPASAVSDWSDATKMPGPNGGVLVFNPFDVSLVTIANPQLGMTMRNDRRTAVVPSVTVDGATGRPHSPPKCCSLLLVLKWIDNYAKAHAGSTTLNLNAVEALGGLRGMAIAGDHTAFKPIDMAAMSQNINGAPPAKKADPSKPRARKRASPSPAADDKAIAAAVPALMRKRARVALAQAAEVAAMPEEELLACLETGFAVRKMFGAAGGAAADADADADASAGASSTAAAAAAAAAAAGADDS